jgi:hypothetical protein
MSSLATKSVKLHEGEIRKALGDSDTAGVVLFLIALYAFGDAVMGDAENGVEQMDPSEMWADLNTRYGTWVTEEGENKLNAIITGLAGGRFWRDADVFVAVSTALFDGDIGDALGLGFDELNATEIMWATLEMGLIYEAEDAPEFSETIQQYVDEVFRYEQEEQEQNALEVESVYLLVLDQLHALGVPMDLLRALDEEYTDAAAGFAAGRI